MKEVVLISLSKTTVKDGLCVEVWEHCKAYNLFGFSCCFM